MSQSWTNALRARKEVRVVALDISKAFDRVWHDGLIHKLECMGVSGPLLAWLRSFLSGRTQRVVINGVGSDFLPMNAGVPQGSVLAPYSSLCSSMTCSTTSTCVLPRLNATTPTYWIRSFIPLMTVQWNNLPPSVQAEANPRTFKSTVNLSLDHSFL